MFKNLEMELVDPSFLEKMLIDGRTYLIPEHLEVSIGEVRTHKEEIEKGKADEKEAKKKKALKR